MDPTTQRFLTRYRLPDELAPLVDAYHEACLQTIYKNMTEGYPANWWLKRVLSHGGAQASVNLILEGQGVPQTGFYRLKNMGQVEDSVEYAVLRPDWRQIFQHFPDVLTYARTILRETGVTPPEEPVVGVCPTCGQALPA
jgi:hypothetical protein